MPARPALPATTGLQPETLNCLSTDVRVSLDGCWNVCERAQAGTSSYSLKFAYPVGLAYAMHDAIMQGRFGAGPFNVKID